MADSVHEELLRAGVACFERGEHRRAREQFAKARRRREGDRVTLFWLGASELHLGHLDEARKLLTSAAWGGQPALPERPAAVHEYLCRCELGSDLRKAAAWGEEGILLDPRDPRIRFVAGTAYHRLGNRKMALAYYDAAWRMEGGRDGQPAFAEHPGQIPFARSTVLMELEHWTDALGAIQDALQRAPESAVYHDRRGVILCEGFGRTEQAIEAVRRAIELDPETLQTGSDGLYYHDLAQFLKQLERHDEALAAAERALSICALRKHADLRDELLALTGNGAAEQAVDFSKVGGMHALKEAVRRIVRVTHTERSVAQRYGITRNGILLHGPPGCGKSLFAEAMAGEFGLHFQKFSLGAAQSRFGGGAAESIERIFQQASAKLPCLLFFDDFDVLAGRRDDAGAHDAQLTGALLQQIEQARTVPGLVVVAATSRFGDLDPAATRAGRFDYTVRMDKPDLDARREILQVLLADRPHDAAIDAHALARELEGLSAAQLRALVDDAALAAMEEGTPISEDHLRAAQAEQTRTNRFGGKRMGWDELVLDAEPKRRLQFIQKFLEHPELVEELGVEPPTGVLLHGPPGTGKTSIARVLASETKGAFFAINAADVFSKWMGESEQRVRELFEKARENVPSIVFIDEIDALLSQRGDASSPSGRAYNTVTNTFLAEMDGIDTHGRVLVIGATNRPELIDEAALRAGRLSEVVAIGLPDAERRGQLLALFTARMRLAPEVDLELLAQQAEGASGADLKGLCTAAGRNAFLRELGSGAGAPSVSRVDFEAALEQLDEGCQRGGRRRAIGF